MLADRTHLPECGGLTIGASRADQARDPVLPFLESLHACFLDLAASGRRFSPLEPDHSVQTQDYLRAQGYEIVARGIAWEMALIEGAAAVPEPHHCSCQALRTDLATLAQLASRLVPMVASCLDLIDPDLEDDDTDVIATRRYLSNLDRWLLEHAGQQTLPLGQNPPQVPA